VPRSAYWSKMMSKPKNERNTENLVRADLKGAGFYSSPIKVEEQKSELDAVQKLLRTAGKAGKGGIGAPEFIISNPNDPDYIVIVECKADLKSHISAACGDMLSGKPVDDELRAKQAPHFAADGALHYASKLSKEFSVIALAVTGETASAMKISTYIFPKGASKPTVLKSKTGASLTKIVSWADYISHATFDPTIQRLRLDELMAFSRELHDFMRDYAKLTENEKPLLVSGTLLALQDKAFSNSFSDYTPAELPTEWMRVVGKALEKAKLPATKLINVTQPYTGISVHPELSKKTKAYPRGVLHELIKRLNAKVRPFISVYNDFDVVGQFYGEFLKYAGGDKKALGIVLTPRHVTELFALLGNVNKDSTVVDICAGTGGFLISSMHQMLKYATTTDEEKRVKKEGLIGVEHLPHMFALAASNMILRGDGKANLYQGSCFDPKIVLALKERKANVGMINPPYSQGDDDLHELVFVKQMLDILKEGAIGIAIVPMRCAISPHPSRAEILSKHTLSAVMSMPGELFYPVGTVTCIMVFTAHKAHALTSQSTWFGYWKDDGFSKTKHRGRIDLDGRWPKIRDRWVSAFRNRNDIPGESVKKEVTSEDEWCAEAYMQTDYSRVLTRDAFQKCVRDYVLFKLVNEAEEKAKLGQSTEDAEEADQGKLQ
jgi:type I restriction enzyme M protein